MHIPDGYLSPLTCAALGAAVVPAWGVSAMRLEKRLGTRQVPTLALGSAFSFVVMMFNVPAPGGTTGHAVGAGLVAILLGPAAAVVTTTVALAIQALIFGDGGVLTFGANCFNMAFLMPVVTYAIYRLVSAGTSSPHRRVLGAALGAFAGINVAALATALETGLQPALAHSPDGTPLYCPYGLGATLPGMLLPHLLIFGPIEAIATGGVVAWALRTGFPLEQEGEKEPRTRALWVGLGVLCLLSPLGLLAAGDAWGEWAPAELKERVGFTPPGLARLAELWKGFLPDYAVPGWGERHPVGYALSSLVGAAAVIGLVWGVGLLLARRRARSGEKPAT